MSPNFKFAVLIGPDCSRVWAEFCGATTEPFLVRRFSFFRHGSGLAVCIKAVHYKTAKMSNAVTPATQILLRAVVAQVSPIICLALVAVRQETCFGTRARDQFRARAIQHLPIKKATAPHY